MIEMKQTTLVDSTKVETVKNFLKEILNVLRISTFNDEKIQKQAERIVHNDVKLHASAIKTKPNFSDKNAKFLFYLSEICARLSDKDSVLAIICIRINDEYERLFNEKKSPSINLKDQKVQKFLKFIFNYFSPQLSGLNNIVSSSSVSQSDAKLSRTEKKKIEESMIERKKGGLLYESFLNLENWSEKATNLSKILNKKDIKKKYLKI